MRWRRAADAAADRSTDPLGDPADAIDGLDADTLEVIELDADGRLMRAAQHPGGDAPPELAEHPSRRDPTGTAGIWEALARS